jgi:hypothetical protein
LYGESRMENEAIDTYLAGEDGRATTHTRNCFSSILLSRKRKFCSLDLGGSGVVAQVGRSGRVVRKNC